MHYVRLATAPQITFIYFANFGNLCHVARDLFSEKIVVTTIYGIPVYVAP